MVVSFDVAFQFPVDFRYPNSDSVANMTKHLLDVTATAKEDAQRLADAISAAETRLPLDNACAKETEDMLLALQGARATLGQLAKRKLMSHTQAAPYDPMVLHTALSWATVAQVDDEDKDIKKAHGVIANDAFRRLTARVEQYCIVNALIHVEGISLWEESSTNIRQSVTYVDDRINQLKIQLREKEAQIKKLKLEAKLYLASSSITNERWELKKDKIADDDSQACTFYNKAHWDRCKALGLTSEQQHDEQRALYFEESGGIYEQWKACSRLNLKRRARCVLTGAMERQKDLVLLVPWAVSVKEVENVKRNEVESQGDLESMMTNRFAPWKGIEARALLRDLTFEIISDELAWAIDSGDPVKLWKAIEQARIFLKYEKLVKSIARSPEALANEEAMLDEAEVALVESVRSMLSRAIDRRNKDTEALLVAINFAEAIDRGGEPLVSKARELVERNTIEEAWNTRLSFVFEVEMKWRKGYNRLVRKGLAPELTGEWLDLSSMTSGLPEMNDFLGCLLNWKGLCAYTDKPEEDLLSRKVDDISAVEGD